MRTVEFNNGTEVADYTQYFRQNYDITLALWIWSNALGKLMRIVMLNNDIEAEDYSHNYRKSNDVVIPIGPTARQYALENNWKIRTLGSLWSEEEYFSAKEDSESRVKTLIKELNENSKLHAENFPIEIGNYFYNNLLIVIGSIHYNYFILKSIQKIINSKK